MGRKITKKAKTEKTRKKQYKYVNIVFVV